MNEDRTGVAEDRPKRTWLERLGQLLQVEPKDRGELREILHDALDRDLLDGDAFRMMDGVLCVAEMHARDIMLPRSQMEVLERDAGLDDLLPAIIESGHSRYPVIGDTRDEVVGILLAKDLLPYAFRREESFNLRDLLRPAFIIPESKRLEVLLKEFRQSRNHMAVVVDEYGGVAGLITIEDVLEQIVGEIADEHDIDEEVDDIQEVAKGCFHVDALTLIEDFNAFFKTDLSDEEFDTVGGLVVNGFGHLPRRGESLCMAGYRFMVLRADRRRIHQLEIRQESGTEVVDDNTAQETGC